MAILKPFQAKTPAVVLHDHEAIYISDDDSSGSDDSDEECDFEDVIFDVTANDAGHTEARFEEVAPDETGETTPAGVRSDAQSDSGVTDGLPPEEGGAREMDDEGITTDTTPHADIGGHCDWDLHDDEASRTEPIDLDQDDSNVPGLPTLRDIVVELGTLRDRVAQLEAQQLVRSACRAPSSSKKRNRTTSATRTYVQWDDTSERCLYTWRRGRDGHCWVGGNEGEAREEVDGEYLLCCATAMSVEIRANADWLPIEVRYNEDNEVFEGQASVGNQRLEVKDSVMMDMMCGIRGPRTASVFC